MSFIVISDIEMCDCLKLLHTMIEKLYRLSIVKKSKVRQAAKK